MLKHSIILSSLLMTPAANTVWWNTGGGSVVQENSGEREKCTLTIESGQARFAFVWRRGLPPTIMAAQADWRLPADATTPVALRIGDVWLGNGNGAPNIAAATGPSAVMIIPDQPFDKLLSSADEVVIRTQATQFGIQVTRAKMTALVTAAHKCRASIGSD